MRLQKKNLSMESKDFIFHKENAISKSSCDKIIKLFEDSSGKERIENNGTPNFTQLNLNQNEKWVELITPLSGTVVTNLHEYQQINNSFSQFFPERICLEEFRIKCYDVDDGFDVHVDVTDKESSIRALAFLYYLNDDFIGGETIFPQHNLTIKPKSGSLIIFPPTWQYPHKGQLLKKGKKYIMSTYLHYY